jgi:hypothetical protein
MLLVTEDNYYPICHSVLLLIAWKYVFVKQMFSKTNKLRGL